VRFLLIFAAFFVCATARAGIDPSEIAADDSKTSLVELERTTSGLQNESTRAAAVKSIGDLGPEATGAITQRLGILRKEDDDGIIAVMQNIAEANPAKYASDDFDLIAALQEPQKRTGTPAWSIALETACLMHALAHIGTTAAVRQIVIASDDHHGQLRIEAGRVVRKLGEKSVAALWIAMRSSSSMYVRKWAKDTLEAMGRRTAADAVQTKSNDVLADVLRAFGTTHDVDAVPVVLAFVNSDRALIRAAARDAIIAYDKDALWKLREAYANLAGKPAPDEWDAKRAATELFAAYDRARLEDVYALLESGLKKQEEGKIADAVADFDKVLARQPLLDRRAEMASAYATYAQSLEDSDRPASIAAYQKAARLDPEGPRAKQIEGALDTLEGEELLAHGVVDTTPFERALAADPGNAKAQKELDRLQAGAHAREEKLHRWSIAGLALATAIAGIVLFGRRRRAVAK